MAEGIRKINEYVMMLGRTLIINDEKLDFNNFELGTLYIDDNANIKVKKKNQIEWSHFTPANLFVNKAITYNFIADKTLTNQQIADNTILNKNIGDLEINSNKIANSAINTIKILDGCIINSKIDDNTIHNNKMLNKTILGNKIADNTMGTSHLIDASVVTRKINNSAITNEKLADKSISSSKIQDLNITTSHYAEGSITTSKIGNFQVTANKIGSWQVTTDKIAFLAVTTDRIADLQVTAAKIGNLQVTNEKLANLGVSTSKIADQAVTTSKIGNRQVTSEKLASDLSNVINTAIRLEATGVANVLGNLYVRNNFNCSGTVSAYKIYNAVYNDLAEGYLPGESLTAGTVVEIREDGKVYKASAFSKSIVGVISDEFAECYGATPEEIATGKKVAVGMIGKVHVSVNGPIKVGDRVVAIGNGLSGSSSGNPFYGLVGKAIESSSTQGIHKVLCLIFPN